MAQALRLDPQAPLQGRHGEVQAGAPRGFTAGAPMARDLVADCAESHIGRPDCLPDDPACGIGCRDDAIAAFVNGDMVDGAVRVRVLVEENEVPTPRRAFALAAEMLELLVGCPRDRPAVVAVHVLGESAAVEA